MNLVQMCDDAGKMLAAHQALTRLLVNFAKQMAVTPNMNETLLRNRLRLAGVNPTLANTFVSKYAKLREEFRPKIDPEHCAVLSTT